MLRPEEGPLAMYIPSVFSRVFAGFALAGLALAARPAAAQTLAVGISEVVRGGVTTDAWGEASSPTTFARGALQIQIPRGGRVREARLYSGVTVFHPNASLPPWPPVVPPGPSGAPRVVTVGSGERAASRTLQGTPRYYSSTVPASGITAWWGTWVTDVTAAVRDAVGPSAAGGPVSVPIAERGDDAAREGPAVIQLGGHFLVVVYELDFGPRRNVVVYEGCATNGYATEALPLPGAVANRCPTTFPRGEPFAASVGVMWEFNRRPNPAAPTDPARDTCSEEESEIIVNDRSLTTRAGGSDDWPSVMPATGCFANTAGLCTMGTFGGTEPGPGRAAGSPVGLDGDQVLTPPAAPRLDDELYDFRTVVLDNARSIRFRFRGDNDEMIPVIAFQTLARGSATDADGDGWSDADEGDCTADSDNDGTPDYLDTDSDNDCLSDMRESATGRTRADIPGRPDLNCPATAPVCDTVAGVCLCNRDTDCTRAPEAPVCDRATRTCVACSSDAQCRALDPTAPACILSGPGAGRCAGCATDAHCAAPRPRCDPSTATCVACATNADCADPARPACDLATHVCRPCDPARASTDCADPALPVCAASGASAGRCVQCGADGDCRAGACDLATNRCVGCRTDADCAGSQPVCDATRRVCRACTPADCRAPTAACATSGPSAGRCVACTPESAGACTGATPACDPATNRCVACTPGPMGDARACATSPDGPVCLAGAGGAAARCGCARDADCGAADSGRICDPTERRCRAGCWPGEGHNGCPRGEACSASDPATPGTCAPGCFRDTDCEEPTARCLRSGDAAGRCVACTRDEHCAARPDGRTRCVPATNTCAAPAAPPTGAGDGGCACRAAGGGAGAVGRGGLWLLALAGALARRRARRR